mgnify:CR=1 FL=1
MSKENERTIMLLQDRRNVILALENIRADEYLGMNRSPLQLSTIKFDAEGVRRRVREQGVKKLSSREKKEKNAIRAPLKQALENALDGKFPTQEEMKQITDPYSDRLYNTLRHDIVDIVVNTGICFREFRQENVDLNDKRFQRKARQIFN